MSTTDEDDCPKPIYYGCYDCNLKRYSSTLLLFTHWTSKHLGLKTIAICPECPTEFRRSNALIRHLAAQHRSHEQTQNRFCCDICDKSCAYVDNLRQHIFQFHPDEKKLFECGFCSKQFYTGSSLKYHVATLHKRTQDAPICDDCNAQSISVSALHTHITRIHLKTSQFCKKNS